MVVQSASAQITGSKTPFDAAINDPTIIPDNDKGKVRRRAALTQMLTFDKIIAVFNS